MNAPKQIIVMRKDLKMPRGKIAAQAAHASMAVLLNMGSIYRDHSDLDGTLVSINFSLPLYKSEFNGVAEINHQDMIDWIEGEFTKICLCVNSEQELADVYDAANKAGLLTSKIVDNGHTVFNGQPTWTCIAIGPHAAERIDPITGHLSLYN